MPPAIYTKNTHFVLGSTFVEMSAGSIWLSSIRSTWMTFSYLYFIDATYLSVYIYTFRNAIHLTVPNRCNVAFCVAHIHLWALRTPQVDNV